MANQTEAKATRREQIFNLLAVGAKTPIELRDATGFHIDAVHRHLIALEDSGHVAHKEVILSGRRKVQQYYLLAPNLDIHAKPRKNYCGMRDCFVAAFFGTTNVSA